MSSRRALLASVGFAATLGVIAYLAWQTALSTTGPWFSPPVSSQVYSVTLLASTILAIGVAVVAALHVASVRHDLMFLNRRIAALRASAGEEADSPTSRAIEDELDEILGTMERTLTSAVIEVREEPASPVVTAGVATKDAVRSLIRELVRERVALRDTIGLLRISVAGPIIASIVFAAIAAAMLPGVDGFGVTNFVLNTTLILFLGYGWPFLVGWAVVGIALSRSIEAW